MYFATWFQLEGPGELEMIERADIALGGLLALAVVLFFAPSQFRPLWAWLTTAVGAALVWTLISGYLIWSHREQYRIRSTMSLQPADGEEA